MAGENILIIDDNPLNLKLLTYIVSAKGYAVRTATTAEEALAILDAYLPAVMLVDIQLPGMDGLELTRRVKASQRTRHIVVFAVTAGAMKGDKERALAAGCDAYFAKPVERLALLAAMASFLEGAGGAGTN